MTAEEAAAVSAVLTAGDLGSEWFSQPRTEQEDEAFGEMALGVMNGEPVCAGVVAWAEGNRVSLADLGDALVPEPLARAESASLTFGPDSVSEVEHTVSVFGSAEEVSDALRRVDELEWSACLRAVFDDLMGAELDAADAGLSITEYSATEPPIVGDQGIRVRFELTIEVAQDRSTIANTIEFSVVGVGRATSALTMFSFDGAIDDAMDDIVAQAADKVAQQFRTGR